MTLIQFLEIAIGAGLVLICLVDLFQSVVLPRPAQNYLRPSYAITRGGWWLWRWVGSRQPSPDRRESMLGGFGPLLVIATLAVIVAGLIVGYGFIVLGLSDQVRPKPTDLGTAIYFSAVSLLTLGYGDIVPTGPAARILITLEAATGLGTVALVISLLFSLYAAFARREVQIINLDAIAGAPPSGVTLLERCSELGIPDLLAKTFDDWRNWSAEVLQFHLAYPVLSYFRSNHDNESWVGALGAMLDAATLVMTTIEGGPHGRAKLMYEVGHHLVEDLAYYFGMEQNHEVGIERSEFDHARQRLAAAGYTLRDADASWQGFSRLRGGYAVALNAMATYWAIPPSQWVGDRSLLRHGKLLRR